MAKGEIKIINRTNFYLIIFSTRANNNLKYSEVAY